VRWGRKKYEVRLRAKRCERQLFEADSKTRHVLATPKIALKIVRAHMLNGINFLRNILALEIVVANHLV